MASNAQRNLVVPFARAVASVQLEKDIAGELANGGDLVADGGALILLAEDDEAQREVLIEVLEVEGYRVLAASGPDEVLASLGQGPALVLLDLMGVASPQVMIALRALPRRPSVVVM